MKMRWKNVLYLLCFIMISLSVYSDDNTEENENKSEEIILQEASNYQIIAINLESGNLEEAEEMLSSVDNSEKESFNYHYYSGILSEERKDNVVALSNYEKALFVKESSKVRFKILSIHINNNADKDLINSEIAKLETLNLTADEKSRLESIKASLGVKEKKKTYMIGAETGLVYTDNVSLTKDDKESDIYSDTRVTLVHKMKYQEDIDVISFASFGNEFYFSNDENNENNFFFGVEPGKLVKDWYASVPTSITFVNVDGENNNTDFSIGIKGRRESRDYFKQYLKKEFKNDVNLTTGADLTTTSNKKTDNKGFAISFYADAETLINDITGTAGTIIEFTNYDLDSENYFGFGAKVKGKKLYKEKYVITAGYELMFKNYKDDGLEMNHLINAEMESNIKDTPWKYSVGYSLEINDSNSSESEYLNNKLSAKVKREFK